MNFKFILFFCWISCLIGALICYYINDWWWILNWSGAWACIVFYTIIHYSDVAERQRDIARDKWLHEIKDDGPHSKYEEDDDVLV